MSSQTVVVMKRVASFLASSMVVTAEHSIGCCAGRSRWRTNAATERSSCPRPRSRRRSTLCPRSARPLRTWFSRSATRGSRTDRQTCSSSPIRWRLRDHVQTVLLERFAQIVAGSSEIPRMPGKSFLFLSCTMLLNTEDWKFIQWEEREGRFAGEKRYVSGS